MIKILIFDSKIIKNSERKDNMKAMEIFKEYKIIRRNIK